MKFKKEFVSNSGLRPQGQEGIEQLGHRDYVGGEWDVIGALQYRFLVENGLRPEHLLMDIACGALRLGVKVIPYLDRGNYIGIDKETMLIEAGLKLELSPDVKETKEPRFVVTSSFEFPSVVFDFAMAQSLFTHLPPKDIVLCLTNARKCMDQSSKFFSTYFEIATPVSNPEAAHDHGYFAYTKNQMFEFAKLAGLKCHYIGDWKHPRNQVMVVHTL